MTGLGVVVVVNVDVSGSGSDVTVSALVAVTVAVGLDDSSVEGSVTGFGFVVMDFAVVDMVTSGSGSP